MTTELEQLHTQQRLSHRRRVILHPLLFAVWPILDLYARHASEVPISDIFGPLAIIAIVVILLNAVLLKLVNNPDVAGVIVTICVLPFFMYGAMCETLTDLALTFYYPLLKGSALRIGHIILVLTFVAIIAILSCRIHTTKRDLRKLTRCINLVAVLLVGFAIFRIVQEDGPSLWRAAASSKKQMASSSRFRALSSAKTEAAATPPDIYYLIFDRYANSSTLKASYDFDNSEFLDGLRRRGFYLAEESHCNYAMTPFSLWSSLNMSYLGNLKSISDVERDLLEGHEVGRMLRGLGYRYTHVLSEYHPTAKCNFADLNLYDLRQLAGDAADVSYHRWRRPSINFTLAVVALTPLQSLFSDALENTIAMSKADTINRQFELLEAVSREGTGPKFVFAHFLLPHPPFVFQKEGTYLFDRIRPETKSAYLAQLKYANRRIEELVDVLLTNSARPPIIVLQADEGPYLREGDMAGSPNDRRRIRTGILNAYHLPDAGSHGLHPRITPVNTFRLIFREFLGVDLDPLDDRIFIWPDPNDIEAQDESENAKWLGGISWGLADFPGEAESFLFQDVTEQIMNQERSRQNE